MSTWHQLFVSLKCVILCIHNETNVIIVLICGPHAKIENIKNYKQLEFKKMLFKFNYTIVNGINKNNWKIKSIENIDMIEKYDRKGLY